MQFINLLRSIINKISDNLSIIRLRQLCKITQLKPVEAYYNAFDANVLRNSLGSIYITK
jgi:hypothetical protein